MVEPRYPRRKSPSQLDPFTDTLAEWLASNARHGRKRRRTLLQMHASLRELGYPGSYQRVCAFYRRWRADQDERERTIGRGMFVPLTFAPGEAFQFDWSEDIAVIGGERRKLQIAQFKLCHSRAFLLRAYPQQTHEMLFDAHNHAFAVFGGVPRRGIREHKGGRTIYDWRHYLCVVQRKPGALRNGAPFASLPKGFKRLQAILLKRPGGDREMVEILALVLQHDKQAVLTAVELALEAGTSSKPHILNLLARLLGESAPAPMTTPPALTLRVEPQADVGRYDALRGERHVA